MNPSTNDRGRAGEERAAGYLQEIGYEILCRNFRFYGAEVDIIARYRAEVHFIEVKSWRSLDARGLEHAVDRKKQERIMRSASGFLSRFYDDEEPEVRFDVIFVESDNGAVRMITDAFEAG